MTAGNENNLCSLACDNIIIQDSLLGKLLGLTINNNFDFKDHISDIRKTANQKLIAILRASATTILEKCSLPTNFFIESHFSYCSLVWVFYNRKIMKNVNQIQERYCCLITNNYELSYGSFLI